MAASRRPPPPKNRLFPAISQPKILLQLSLLLSCLSCLCQSTELQQILLDPQEDLSSNFVRNKRDILEVTNQDVSNLAFATQLNSSHLHLMVHWAGQGSPVVFVLARSQTMDSRANSKTFISR